jgi:hypothetical protein
MGFHVVPEDLHAAVSAKTTPLSRCQDGLSAVFLIRPIPAKKNTAPRMEKIIIDFTLLAPPELFIKFTADIIRPATPNKVRMIPSIRFSI